MCSLRETYTLTVDEVKEGAAYQIISDLNTVESVNGLTIGQRAVYAADLEEFADVMESAKVSGTVSENASSMKNLNKIKTKGQNKNEFAARPLSLSYDNTTNAWTFETVRLLNNSTNTTDIPEVNRILQAQPSTPEYNVFYVGEDMSTTIGYNVVDADGTTILASGAGEQISFTITGGALALSAALSMAALTLSSF